MEERQVVVGAGVVLTMHAQLAGRYGQGLTRGLNLSGEIVTKERREGHFTKGQLYGW